MLESYFKAPFTVNRLRAGPAGKYVDGFVERLEREGYSWWTARRYVRCATHLGCFLDARGTALEALDEETLGAFQDHLRCCRCRQANGGTTQDAWRGVRRFVEYLRDMAVVEGVHTRQAPPLIESFRLWLQQHRGVAESTLYRYTRGATELLDALGNDPKQYDARSLRTLLLARADSCGIGAAKSLATALRAFLRYLSAQGECEPGLEHAIPALAGWRLAALPQPLAASDVQRMIEACESTSPIGIRNRAILLLLVRLGLRAGDVASLGLCDIDWGNGSFLVCGKGRRQVRLPLPQEVGDAVLRYLKCRPAAVTDRVFVRARAPFRCLLSSAVSAIVTRAMRRAEVVAPSHGAHILRHTAATDMLRQGVSLDAIRAVLRHRSVEMSAYYAKVDLGLLQEIAQPWPEVLSC